MARVDQTLLILAAALTMAASILSCSTSTTTTEPLPLADCAIGLWARTFQPCDCEWLETPECRSPTCQEILTACAVREDGTMADFSLRYTTDAPRTVSVVGGVGEGSWSVVDEQHLDRHYGTIPSVGPATCTATTLSWRGIVWERADARIRDAILPVLREDMSRWVGVPY